MSLSSGTLNLKFMQRAAARSGAPAAVAEPTGPIVEDANKWVLPRRGNAEAGPSKPRVQFVASYMPFLEAGEAEGADGGDGGRRSFGGFGRKEAEEEKEEEGDSDEMDYDSEEDERKRRVRDKKSKKEKEEEVCFGICLADLRRRLLSLGRSRGRVDLTRRGVMVLPLGRARRPSQRARQTS